MKELLELFFTFFRMGCVTFGGGYAILPVIERELVTKKGWATIDEVMDYYTIAQVTPGVIAVNVSTFLGYKRKGLLGGAIATLGFVFPSLILITVIAACLANFADIPAVKHAFGGIRVAVGALILDTVIRLITGIFRDIKAIAIFIIALGLSAVFSASPVLLVLAAGTAGFFLYRPKKAGAP
ncbi:chromate transporter [Spirochaetia bacterium]|nr:chromate transporter [Spirochaetia bacterium]